MPVYFVVIAVVSRVAIGQGMDYTGWSYSISFRILLAALSQAFSIFGGIALQADYSEVHSVAGRRVCVVFYL